MRRREFLKAIVLSATTLPFAARAQQPNVPVIGYLYAGTLEANPHSLAGFRKGLLEMGFVEGRDVLIEFRAAENNNALLPELANDLISHRVSVIAVPGSRPAALAAIAATTTIPIVFSNGNDPVQSGLVPSLNRPGGNVTGVTDMGRELSTKRVGLLHELLPGAKRLAVLVAFKIENSSELIIDLQTAASRVGMQIEVLTATTNDEISTAFEALVKNGADAIWVSPGALFFNRRVQIVSLAARHAVPAIYPFREFVEVGGLISYGSSIWDRSRLAGIYVGRILKGEKPANLPVLRATKFELVINVQTAKILGITVPPVLLSQADEALE